MRYGNEIPCLPGVHSGLTDFLKMKRSTRILVLQMTISLTPVKH
jgi:hypothetical protein